MLSRLVRDGRVRSADAHLFGMGRAMCFQSWLAGLDVVDPFAWHSAGQGGEGCGIEESGEGHVSPKFFCFYDTFSFLLLVFLSSFPPLFFLSRSALRGWLRHVTRMG